jgi:transcriptional regulator with XRE-family HTH domain
LTINERIKKVRKLEKLSQTEFAEKLGVTQPSLSDIEKGKTINIDERNIKLICTLFNINEKWVKTGEGEMYSDSGRKLDEMFPELIAKLSDLEKKVVLGFMTLSDKDREIVMKAMQKMFA